MSDALAERLFEPQRLSELLHAVLAAEQSKEAGQRAELLRIETELASARAKLDRLMSVVSAGAIDATDPDLKAHMDAARQDRDIALAAKQQVEKRLQLASSFSPEKVVAFGQFCAPCSRRAACRSASSTRGCSSSGSTSPPRRLPFAFARPLYAAMSKRPRAE